MWQPTEWAEVDAALGVLVEGPSLDFKEAPALNNGREIAKDVAAMAILGGTIAYGISEVDEIAAAAPGVQLHGAVNRIQQIVDTNIEPPVSADIRSIENPATPGSGVIIVHVPASLRAPHWTNDRFPARSGTTTRYLSEREIAELYERRAQLQSIPEDEPGGARGSVVAPEWLRQPGLDMTDVGMMLVGVAPVGVREIADYRLERHLAEVGAAASAVEAELVDRNWSRSPWSARWRPYRAEGWCIGHDPVRDDALRNVALSAITYTYRSGFSFLFTCPLEYNGQPYIYERVWAADLVAALIFAATFYKQRPLNSMLRIDLSLQGLDGARPGPGWDFPGDPRTVPGYNEHRVLATTDVVHAPLDACRALLDRFFASIDSDRDIIAAITRTP